MSDRPYDLSSAQDRARAWQAENPGAGIMSTDTLLHILGDITLMPDPNLVKTTQPKRRPRTWRARLFRRPWRPWVRYEWVTHNIPDLTQVYLITEKQPFALVAHPKMIEILSQQIARRKP